ncbi:lysine N(6)-hydroxylase/L-ornithine N(5)-oxygenase family protein [Thermocrispum municipale]|uniref:lysine N(6)-hydroxylase/L-ornithine N(5)-oxygenase family protein n=1 Tax=Thermocrispum municipale TaxID=37926 RepID=UPI00048BAEB0|nr:SidA/IucD/PvdA family monooxygenase [Thermocrispum municipale]
MSPTVPVYDLVGVGFGPANLALAIALAEYDEQRRPEDPVLTAHFLERQESFAWHSGMLIDDATMQVSFLKDLVTLRNPASRFSFLSYLHAHDRLVDFVNHKSLFPLRVEFNDYFRWCAEAVADQVAYGREVTAVRPVEQDGEIGYLDVVTSAGDVYRARNLVLATGLIPTLPHGVARGERIWHSSELLHQVDGIDADDAKRFVVVGAGQSAAEVTAFLHEKFPTAEVCSVFSRYGMSPADDSPLANRIFDPATVDEFYYAPEPMKRKLMDYHANTNYSVVDLDLIEELYRRSYREKVLGNQRLRWFNASRTVDVVDTGRGALVTVESMLTGERTVLDVDAAVFATGYRCDDSLPLLGDLARRCHRDECGRLRVARDYRVVTDECLTPAIYLQGGSTEHTHGITSSLLSNNAVRAGEIVQSLVHRMSSRQSVLSTAGTR